MPNINFFDDNDYELETIRLDHKWVFSCKLFGMQIRSVKSYTTEVGALRAGRKWLEKNFHNEL